MFDLAVIGEINVDVILKCDVTPAFGQAEQLIDAADVVMGSSAVIFACGAARLGLRTAFIGKVGDDLFGSFMLKSMQQRGIDISGVIVDREIKTGFSVILARQGDRAILTFPGSIPELSYTDINYSLVAECRHLHLTSLFLLEKLRPDIPRLFHTAREMGLSVSLDTNYDPKEEWDGGLEEALQNVDVFLPNETEARAISKTISIEKALHGLSTIVPSLAIKLGDTGAVAAWPGGAPLYQSAPSIDVVDTVGAGDSFDAGFIYGYLNGWTPEQTLALAVTCGTLSTLKPGGTAGQPHLDEATDFMKKFYKEKER